jgi:hypothetical protein
MAVERVQISGSRDRPACGFGFVEMPDAIAPGGDCWTQQQVLKDGSDGQ